MSRLNWDATGKRKYENGISHGVLYTQYPIFKLEVSPRGLAYSYKHHAQPAGGYRTFNFFTSTNIAGKEYAYYPAFLGDYPTGWNVEWEEVDGVVLSKDPSIVRTEWNVTTPGGGKEVAWINTNYYLTRTEVENAPKDYVLNKLDHIFNAANVAVGQSGDIEITDFKVNDSGILFVKFTQSFNGLLVGALNNPFRNAWTGISRPYVGVAWNGLTNVTESPDGAEPNDLWADNSKYASPRSKETFGMTIEAYTYPDDFCICDGTKQLIPGVKLGQQTRQNFCMAYRTNIGNDAVSETDDYLLHLVYNCTVSPSDRAYETINDSPDAITFSWEGSTVPETFSNYDYSPVSTIVIDSEKAKKRFTIQGMRKPLELLEMVLYGTDGLPGYSPTMPSPDYVVDLFRSTYSMGDPNTYWASENQTATGNGLTITGNNGVYKINGTIEEGGSVYFFINSANGIVMSSDPSASSGGSKVFPNESVEAIYGFRHVSGTVESNDIDSCMVGAFANELIYGYLEGDGINTASSETYDLVQLESGDNLSIGIAGEAGTKFNDYTVSVSLYEKGD